MQVNVEYGLPGIPTVIDHHTVPVPVQRPLFSDRLSYKKEMPYSFLVALLHTVNVSKVLLRNDKDMDRRLRIDVLKGKARLVLVDDLRRDLPSDDLAEEAIRTAAHHGSLFSEKLLKKQLRAPVWQAGPVCSTLTRSVSWSQSY